jgi:nucleoside-diphosphate-sugar epimerase
VTEAHPTVPPADATYSTRKVMMERTLLDGARVPVTVLRPCAIHGPGSSHAREWWFIKRALDSRRRVPLAYCGRSRFHTTAAETIAETCRVSVEAGGSRILNVGDPDPPDVAEIGRLIGEAMRHEWHFMPVAEGLGLVGRTPWSVPRPFLMDTVSSQRLGVQARPYAHFVPSTCAALIEAASTQSWEQAFPALARYPYDLFDYAAEDRAMDAADTD